MTPLTDAVRDMIEAPHVFDYDVLSSRERFRGEGRWRVREIFTAPIPSYGSDAFESRSLTGSARELVADGRMFAPVHGHGGTSVLAEGHDLPEGARTCSHAELSKAILTAKDHPTGSTQAYTIRDVRFSRKDMLEEERRRLVVDASTLRDIRESNRAERLELARIDVSHLCYVDGVLHTSRDEPVRTSDQWQHANGRSTLGFHVSARDVYESYSFERTPPLIVPHDVDIPGQVNGPTDPSLLEGLDLRHPTTTAWIRCMLAAGIASTFRPMGGNAHVGSASMANPDVPPDLDEAVFDLRRSLRAMDVDLRLGPVPDEVMDLATTRLETFVEIYRRETRKLFSSDRKHSLLAENVECLVAHRHAERGPRP